MTRNSSKKCRVIALLNAAKNPMTAEEIYIVVSKENDINLEQIKSGTYVNNNGYSLGNINSLHSELPTFLSHFKGVSTKHLQHYLDWFCFQKLINYTLMFIFITS